MELIPGVFDGTHLILRDGTLVSLAEISRGGLELKPYLVFAVEVLGDEGEMEASEMEVFYPHVAETAYEKSQLVYGLERPTRIYHYFDEESRTVVRKPDLHQPHQVTTFGYRQLTIEKKDGTRLCVDVSGNCRHPLVGARELKAGQERVPLTEFFDYPSEFVNIMKKAGLEVYTK